MEAMTTKADLHVHSAFSKRPSIWVMQKLGCPESFTSPEQLYTIAKQRGMDLVTITDHNSIEGCLEIAGRPDVFISEEVTTYFPRDRCKIHLLVYDMTEAQHEEIQRVREDVYALAEYLNDEGLFHAVAHPFAAVNERLTLSHFEELLLLFKTFEINGDHDAGVNASLRQVLAGLTAETIDRLSEAHKMEPACDNPWQKHLVGGSDDHSSLNIARTYTEVVGRCAVPDLLEALACGGSRIVNNASSPRIMAHTIYSITYQFYCQKLKFRGHVSHDIFLRFLDRSLQEGSGQVPEGLLSRILRTWKPAKAPAGPASGSLVDVLRHEATTLILRDKDLRRVVESAPDDIPQSDDAWFRFVDELSNKVLFHFSNHLLDRLVSARLFDVFHSLGSAGALYAMLAPYFVAFSMYSKERWFSREAVEHFTPDATETGRRRDGIKVAHFTDTFFEMNGLARTLQQQLDLALKHGQDLTVFTCRYGEHTGRRGVRAFEPIGCYAVPVYPDQKLFFPPLLEALNCCYEEAYTHIHAATPGPLGLAALAIGRILKVPVMATYHTALPQYGRDLTEDASVEDMLWHYLVWFYNQVDVVFVSSKHNREELVARGVERKRISIFPRGVDTARFTPAKRGNILQDAYGIAESTVLLYVGRVSREKNLPLLAKAFTRASAEHKDLHLLVVGDGPFRAEMERELQGMRCTFTGYLEGEALAETYASADVFVFPSTTDTFGNVVLEAQVSGLPVIVSDVGGPAENVLPDVTGLVVPANDEEALVRAITRLGTDRALRRRMGVAAHRALKGRSFDTAFDQLWQMYGEVAKGKQPGEPVGPYRLVEGGLETLAAGIDASTVAAMS